MPKTAMHLPRADAFMVASMIRNGQAKGPLLLRVAQAQYGTLEEVVYAPNGQLNVLKREIEAFLASFGQRTDSKIPGENMAGRATVGSLKAFLTRLLAVVDEGIREKKGLFVITD
jgi:hypothetical protein